MGTEEARCSWVPSGGWAVLGEYGGPHAWGPTAEQTPTPATRLPVGAGLLQSKLAVSSCPATGHGEMTRREPVSWALH